VGSSTAIAVGVNSDSTWYAISIPVAPGGTGWIDAAYAIPQDTSGLPDLPAPPVPPSVDLVPPAAGDPQATAIAETYVRTGPGTNYPAYGFAPAGANARVIGKNTDGSWLVVRLDPTKVGAGYGWVETAFTTPSNIDAVAVINAPEAPPVVEAPAPAEGAPTATAIDYINVRSGPGTNYYILGYAAPGATAEVSGKSEDGAWWQVKIPTSFSPDGFGWVSADWVTTANTDSVAVVAAPAPPTNAVSTQPPPATSCTLVSQDPADGTHFAPSTGFGVSWVLKNTGSTSWEGPNTNLVFLAAVSGQRLHQNGDMYGISQNVDPGGTYTVSGSMISPADPGQYGEAWSLINTNGTTYCTFWIIINVP
jgi:uncharacterized protein YraI